VNVVTFEFENVPAAASRAAAEAAPVRPDGNVLHITQQRLREKRFLESAGFPVAPFRAILTPGDLERAAVELGCPLVLKTAEFGYDGKGQRKLQSVEEAFGAHQALGGVEAVAESWVDFEKEVSVIVARGGDGTMATYPVFENTHARHILDLTIAPAAIPPETAAEACAIARGVAEAVDLAGLMTVEMFLGRDGRLLVNELAPRTHNSGHLTIDAAETSQFEQQVRAVCGLPLGSTRLREPAAMANLLGDIWVEAGGRPRWEDALAVPGVQLHLYGKATPRVGRKMGHLTATHPDVETAKALVLEARRRLAP
jgi:5-(carboxyamino)imidazole ribonucleotide synthase